MFRVSAKVWGVVFRLLEVFLCFLGVFFLLGGVFALLRRCFCFSCASAEIPFFFLSTAGHTETGNPHSGIGWNGVLVLTGACQFGNGVGGFTTGFIQSLVGAAWCV